MNITNVNEATPAPAGLGSVLLIALLSATDTCPDTPNEAAATSYANYATVSDPITFGNADGTGFYEFPVLSTKDAKPKVTRTLSNANTGAYENTLEAVRLNSNDPETIGFFKTFVGKPIIVLAKTGKCSEGQYVRVGDGCNPARIETVESDSGSGSGDDNQTTFTIVNAGEPAPIYTGAVTLASANVA